MFLQSKNHPSVQQLFKTYSRALLLSGSMLAAAGVAADASSLKENADYPGRHDPTFADTVACDCTQAGEPRDKVAPEMLVLWQQIQRLRDSPTLTGPALADFADRTNIFYCYKPLPPGTDGQWRDHDGVVRIAKRDRPLSAAAQLLNAAHETVHAEQRLTGVSREDLSWTLPQKQMEQLCMEASARAAEFVIALEFLLQGDDSLWREKTIVSPEICNDVLIAYTSALDTQASYTDILSSVGTTAFYAHFCQQEWLDFYNEQILSRHIYLLAEGQLKEPSKDKYTLETARKTGYISPAFNMTAQLPDLPAYTHCFGENTQMRQAFDYAQLEHLAATKGRENRAYLKMLKRLENEGNPYLGVDLQKAYAAFEAPNGNHDLLRTLNICAGITFQRLENAPPTPPKISMRVGM